MKDCHLQLATWISTGLLSGPLIYLYIRTLLNAPFRLTRKDYWHFAPMISHLIYRIFILIYDCSQENWLEGFDGELFEAVHISYMSIVIRLLEYSSVLLYLAFTVQLFTRHKRRIKQFFSNTYQLELKWIQLFLSVFFFLFIYHTITDLADAIIEELSYIHSWCYRFAEAGIMVFFGLKAYFTNLQKLEALSYEDTGKVTTAARQKSYTTEMQVLSDFLINEKAYLKADFTLAELAKSLNMNTHEVSEVINSGFGVNFNEWINSFRVEEVKKKLNDPANDHISILGIAFDCGFNSKATFNRIFKQLTGSSPSDYKRNRNI